MKDVAGPISYALFVWWFTTGLVFLMVLRRRVVVRWSLAGAAVLFPVCLYLLAKSSAQTGVAAVYVAFTAAVVLWGTQEIAFLTGFLTGPRPLPCPPEAGGLPRAGYAILAILYHELALIASALAIVVVTWGGANQVGALAFLVLYVMRVSAKLNLFLGVPVLNDDIMPSEIAYLRSYFSRGAVNGFFPIAMLGSILLTVGFVDAATDSAASSAVETGYVLLAALVFLAILEHVFMLVPLPIDRLWRWSTRARGDQPSRAEPKVRVEPDHSDLGAENVMPTRP